MSRRKPRQIGEPDDREGSTTRLLRPGRQTIPSYSSYFGMLPYAFIPRRRYEQYDISRMENSYLSATQLLALLPDLNSDVSLALWNTVRLAGQGFDFEVMDSTGNEDEKAEEMLHQLLSRIQGDQGGMDNLIGQWLMTAFLQGAIAAEVALTENLKDIENIHAVDPSTIKFSRDAEHKLVPYATTPQGAQVLLNPATFWYVPIDPWVDDPYGRPPAAPVLQEVWFDIALLHDLRKVVHNQGWPRIDISVIEETIRNTAPPKTQSDPVALRAWINARLTDVQTAYNDLQPDDTFIHLDSVQIAQAAAGGTASGSQLINADPLMQAIEHRIIKALKQLPILMGQNIGTTQTHGTVQWQIYVAGLRSLQQPICFLMERVLMLCLEVYGIQGRVECSFEELRTTDRLADAQAEKLEIANAQQKWTLGATTWADMVTEISGSPPPEGAVEPDPADFAQQPGGGGILSVPVDLQDVRRDQELTSYPRE